VSNKSADNSTAKLSHAALIAVVIISILICPCSALFASFSGTGVGIETRGLDLTIRKHGYQRQQQSPSMILDLTGTNNVGAFKRGCDGLSLPLGDLEIHLMGCTTEILR
jgi:hypothetical protein